MPHDDAVTRWITKLSEDEDRAAQVVWNAYVERLADFVRVKLHDMPPSALQEDAAWRPIQSFCSNVAAGHFPDLDDRSDLWRLVLPIAAHSADAHLRRQAGKKSQEDTRLGNTAYLTLGTEVPVSLDEILGSEPTAELAQTFIDESHRLVCELADEMLRTIAISKLAGETNDRIAESVNCVLPTVERKLERIREFWSLELIS